MLLNLCIYSNLLFIQPPPGVGYSFNFCDKVRVLFYLTITSDKKIKEPFTDYDNLTNRKILNKQLEGL